MADTPEAKNVNNSDVFDEPKIEPKSVSVNLGNLIVDNGELSKAYKTRKSATLKMRVPISEMENAENNGWKITRRLKRVAFAQKDKSKGQYLEDRVWCLCRDMGYPTLNSEACSASYSRDDGTTGVKQFNVFAKDDETSIVFECKTREVRGRKSLSRDLDETASLKKSIANTIRSKFGSHYNPKILWIYVTENIVWTESDVARASSEGVRIITENELQYFEAFVGHVGSAGKYQFLAEFLQGQEIPGLSGYKVPAVKGRLGSETFYSFTVPAGQLLKIAFVNHHALNNPDGTPAYQRMVDKKRLSNIGQFITDGGYFPTNVLINFTQACKFEPLSKSDNTLDDIKFGHLTLPNKYKSAWIIDGQHRLLGFTNLNNIYLKQPLFVVAFEQMETVKEAELFITINHKQKSVPPSLLVALQADLQMGSDDPEEALSALASFLIRKLSADSTSPLFNRFQIPGVPASDAQVLTVPEIQKGLKRSQLLGRVVKKVRLGGYLSDATDTKTLDRARRTINGYFKMIEDTVPAKWAAGRSGHIVTNPAIRAHLQLLNEILRYQHAAGKIDPALATPDEIVGSVRDFCEPLLAWLKTAPIEEIESRFSKQYGEGGVREYFFNLCDLLLSSYDDFGPDEFRDHKSKSQDVRRAQAKLDVEDMTKTISSVVVEQLKEIYGTDELPSGEKKYWELGISDSKIKQSAYNAQQQTKAEKRAPREAYLHIIDFETIIRQKGNWEYLKPIFSIPLRGVNPKSKEYHLDWIKEFNDIRNIASHSSIYRQLSDDDLDFLSWLKQILYERCIAAGVNI